MERKPHLFNLTRLRLPCHTHTIQAAKEGAERAAAGDASGLPSFLRVAGSATESLLPEGKEDWKEGFLGEEEGFPWEETAEQRMAQVEALWARATLETTERLRAQAATLFEAGFFSPGSSPQQSAFRFAFLRPSEQGRLSNEG